MIKELRRVIRINQVCLLAVSVMCGPGLWISALGAAHSAWSTRNDDSAVLGFLFLSSVIASWALWGILSGPEHLWTWWFGLTSMLNLLAGLAITVSDEPYAIPVGVLFFGYSLWQFLVFHRPAPPRWPQNDD